MLLVTSGEEQIDGTRVSRVGKTAAAQTTALLIERFHPTLIVNAGTAGGIVEGGAKIGDVFTGSVQQHDAHMPTPPFKTFGHRMLETIGPDIVDHLKLPVKKSVISTGDSFEKSSHEWKHIKNTDAIVIEMEAMAVADVISNMTPNINGKISLLCLKGITELGKREELDSLDINKIDADFDQNFKKSVSNVTRILKSILDQQENLLHYLNSFSV